MNHIITKAKLLDMIRTERAHLEATLAQMNEVQMSQPGIEDMFSAKDIIAHIVAWEQRLMGWLRVAASGKTPEIPAPGLGWDDIEQLDAETFFENRNRSLSEVMNDFQLVHQQLLAELNALPEDPDDERWAVWEGGQPPWELILANSYDHYREHGEPIRAWLAKVEASLPAQG